MGNEMKELHWHKRSA